MLLVGGQMQNRPPYVTNICFFVVLFLNSHGHYHYFGRPVTSQKKRDTKPFYTSQVSTRPDTVSQINGKEHNGTLRRLSQPQNGLS